MYENFGVTDVWQNLGNQLLYHWATRKLSNSNWSGTIVESKKIVKDFSLQRTFVENHILYNVVEKKKFPPSSQFIESLIIFIFSIIKLIMQCVKMWNLNISSMLSSYLYLTYQNFGSVLQNLWILLLFCFIKRPKTLQTLLFYYKMYILYDSLS